MKRNELKNSSIEVKGIKPYDYLLKNDRVCDFLNVLSRNYNDININLFTDMDGSHLFQRLTINMFNGRINLKITNEPTANSSIYCNKSLKDLKVIELFLKEELATKLYAQSDFCFISKDLKKMIRKVTGLINCDESQIDDFSFQYDAFALFDSELGYDKDRPELGKVKEFDYVVDEDFSLLISILEEFSDIFSCIFK